jgi:hypothetical protein
MDSETAEILAGCFGCDSGHASWPGFEQKTRARLQRQLAKLGIPLTPAGQKAR